MRQKLPHLCNTKSTSLPLTLTIISAFLPALMKDRSSPIQSSVSTAPYTHQLLNPKKKFPPANRTLLMLHEQSSALHWSILIGTQSLVLCIKKNLLNILLSAILLYYHFTATLLEKVVCSLPLLHHLPFSHLISSQQTFCSTIDRDCTLRSRMICMFSHLTVIFLFSSL